MKMMMMISKPFLSSSLLLCSLTCFLLFSPTTPTRWERKMVSWDTTNITLLGDAAIKNGSIILTSPSRNGTGIGTGRALYSHPVRFLEPTTHSSASFSTNFSFSIYPSPSFGNGIAFLITSHPQFLGNGNGYMGLFDEEAVQETGCTNDDSPVTIAVEFDTSLDSALHDINDNHVGIDLCSIFSVASANAGNGGVNLRDERPMTAWIEYSTSKKIMKVWVSCFSIRPPNPLLVTNIDLSRIFRETMYIGFSASNPHGSSGAAHVVHKWSFRTYGFGPTAPPSSIAMPISYGPEVASNVTNAAIRSTGMRRIVRVGVIVAAAVILIFLIGIIYWITKRRRSERNEPADDVEGNALVARISLDKIKTATKDFHRSRIIGHGGTGTMYEGVLPSGYKVAVKKFGRVEQFTNTFATVLGCSRHPNLVPLKGWCCEKDELLLVYELMPRGSLYDILHSGPTTVLSWDKRFNIILGIGSALSFLHNECEKKIVHGDVRTCNVLLDTDFSPRLGGFGLAMLNEYDRAMGYLAPEYVHSGLLTEKLDIYGFGIVALEVASGRRAVDKGVVLVDWVWGLWGNRRLIEAVDRRLRNRFKEDELVRMLIVGLSCAHPDCDRRPSIRKVMKMLKGERPLPVVPAMKPAVRLLSHIPQAFEDSVSVSVGLPTCSGDDAAQWSTPCTSFSQLN